MRNNTLIARLFRNINAVEFPRSENKQAARIYIVFGALNIECACPLFYIDNFIHIMAVALELCLCGSFVVSMVIIKALKPDFFTPIRHIISPILLIFILLPKKQQHLQC